MNRLLLQSDKFHLLVSSVAGLLILSGCGADTAQPVFEKQTGPAIQSAENLPMTKVVSMTGDRLYKSCAACHLPSGEGVAGVFPSLKGDVARLLNSDLGREYLILVVYYGLSGEIKLNDMTYNGMMAASGAMNPERVAAVLNYVMQSFNDVSENDPRLFSSDFVAATQSKYGRLSTSKVYAFRDAAYASVRP